MPGMKKTMPAAGGGGWLEDAWEEDAGSRASSSMPAYPSAFSSVTFGVESSRSHSALSSVAAAAARHNQQQRPQQQPQQQRHGLAREVDQVQDGSSPSSGSSSSTISGVSGDRVVAGMGMAGCLSPISDGPGPGRGSSSRGTGYCANASGSSSPPLFIATADSEPSAQQQQQQQQQQQARVAIKPHSHAVIGLSVSTSGHVLTSVDSHGSVRLWCPHRAEKEGGGQQGGGGGGRSGAGKETMVGGGVPKVAALLACKVQPKCRLAVPLPVASMDPSLATCHAVNPTASRLCVGTVMGRAELYETAPPSAATAAQAVSDSPAVSPGT
jgi:hypothetical protein